MRKEMEPAEREAQLRAADARRVSDEEKLERMMLYGQSAACRWRMLLDTSRRTEIADQPDFRCGTCDNCVHPLEREIAPPTSLRHAVQIKVSGFTAGLPRRHHHRNADAG